MGVLCNVDLMIVKCIMVKVIKRGLEKEFLSK